MTAQIDDLLTNKDIPWIAETYNNFQTSEPEDTLITKSLNRVSLLKFIKVNEQSNLDEKFAFQNVLLIAISKKQITCYADEDCKIENPNWYSGADTLMLINPITYKEELRVVYSSVWAGSISVFRARQIIYYIIDEEDAQTRNADVIPYLLDLRTRDNMINSRDTVAVLEKNEYKINVITNRINLSKINRLRLIQEWYWDDRKHELSIRLGAVAPNI
jgi:hypothetical protein